MRTETGLRLGQLRRLGTDTFTWADPLRNPPALVLVSGLQTQAPDVPDVATLPDALCCISFSDPAVLADRECIASTVNIAHEILMRCDSWEIASYIHGRKIKALLGAIGRGRWQYVINLSGSVPSSGGRGNFP